MLRKRAVVFTTISFVLCAVFTGLLFAYAHAMNKKNCAENLHYIGSAIRSYTSENNHHYPDTFEHLLDSTSLNMGGLVCPSSQGGSASSVIHATSRNIAGYNMYIYAGKSLSDSSANDRAVIAFEPLSNHITGMNVLFGDGHIEFVDRRLGQAITDQETSGKPSIFPPQN